MNDEKRLEILPDEADIVLAAFNRYETTFSQHGTIKYIRKRYDVNWCDATFRRMLHEKLYTGVYDWGSRVNEIRSIIVLSSSTIKIFAISFLPAIKIYKLIIYSKCFNSMTVDKNLRPKKTSGRISSPPGVSLTIFILLVNPIIAGKCQKCKHIQAVIIISILSGAHRLVPQPLYPLRSKCLLLIFIPK